MFFQKIFPIALIFSALWLQSCIKKSEAKTAAASAIASVALPKMPENVGAENYWYQGKAELSTFDVEQERYGEMRRAEQVMVFVTEDFSAKKQVKLDDAAAAGDDRIPVLKLNALRRFKTGIYDYSLMQSVFTPVETSRWRTLKTTTTIQDWCGHVFTQFNVGQDGYRVRNFSYFETEGDSDATVKPGLLEDEIWTLLRLQPDDFLKKETTVVPSTFYTRLRHKPILPEKAAISIENMGSERVLHLVYADIPRKLDIRFEAAFPYRILAWEETDGGKLMSKGTLKKTILNDYWKNHDNDDLGLRAELNLNF